MPANLASHAPIRPVRTVSGNQPQVMSSYQEKATQTFIGGTPVQLNGGFVQAWDGATVAAGILGVVKNDAGNFAANGGGMAPGVFGSVGNPGTFAGMKFGSVPNQTSAVNIPHGAPAVDGRDVVVIANNDTLFEAVIDNNTGANFTLLAADIGTQMGLTKDTAGFWYVDRGKVTAGTNTVVMIVEAHPVDGFVANARVWFKFLATSFQYLS